MAAISQTTISHAFSLMKMFISYLNVTEVCSYGSNWRYYSIGLDNGLALTNDMAPTNDSLGCRRIYASLGLNESTECLCAFADSS